jgi:acetolactate synthase I/II/III large subunit
MKRKAASKPDGVSRRAFLGRTILAGAAVGFSSGETVAATTIANTDQTTPAPDSKPPLRAIPAPNLATETENPTEVSALTFARSGSDFMVDVIKTLNIPYIAANPGSTFRGLQESLIDYGNNQNPEFLLCCHEESSVAMAHGYFKITGKPMAALVHGTVGVQHASMAIYNAYADRVPVIILSGDPLDANTRRVPIEWDHSVQDNALMVRDYTKWDDTPRSLQHFAESMVRAYKVATALPAAPVMLTVDMELQENELPKSAESKLKIPALTLDTPPQGEEGALREAARLLANAERPVIVADRYARSPAAITLLVELAELVQSPVLDTGNRVNFPRTHPLNQSGRSQLLAEADFILALEPVDLWGLTHELRDVIGKPWESTIADTATVVSIGTGDLLIKANYQDFQRYSSAHLAITGDPETSMPAFIEMVRREVSRQKKSTRRSDRRRALESEHRDANQRARDSAAVGWDLSPVHPARIAMEVWDQIKTEDWSVVGYRGQPGIWAGRLWPMDKFHNHTGGTGAGGVGYGAPAAVGAALANRDQGRLSINFQNDGDLMYAPGVLWTAAHHRIPLLNVMFNNRGYHQELMHVQVMANRLNRGRDRAPIGTALRNPDIDFAHIARGMGVYAEGPISDPNELRAAIGRALAVVKKGEPALIDVISQPR